MKNIITMFKVDTKKHILFDASFIVALFNKLDSDHKKALDYIEKMPKNKKALLSTHCLFEIMAAVSRRKKY